MYMYMCIFVFVMYGCLFVLLVIYVVVLLLVCLYTTSAGHLGRRPFAGSA